MRVNKYDEDENDTKFKWSVIRRALSYLKKDKKTLFLIFIVVSFSNILSLLFPKFIEYMTDVAVPNKDYNIIFILALVALIIIIIDMFVYRWQGKKLAKVQQTMAYNLKTDLFNHLQYLPASFYDSRASGKILIRVTNYAENVSEVICGRVFMSIFSLITLVFVLIFMFFTNVALTFYVIFVAILFALVFIIITPIRRKYQKIAQNKDANATAYLQESLNGLLVTQSFNRESKNALIFSDLEEERLNARYKTYKYGNAGWALGGAISFLVTVSIYLLGVFIFGENITIGVLLAMGAYSTRFWDPIIDIVNIYGEFMDSVTYLERIFEFIDEPLVIENNKNAIKREIDGNIEFKNVSFAYNDRSLVLENISFNINKNSKVAFVGKTGSGKSTIINLICRYYDKGSGEILIDGTPITDYDLKTLRKQIHVMLQDNYVFSKTVMENLKYGNPDIEDDKVLEVCKKLNIHDFIINLKDGYNTVLLNNASELSTGQRQLLCLARTIISDPKILILDEATSNVDLKTEKDIENAVNILMEGRTCIIIAHRLSTIKSCDEIFVVKDKKIIESGNHEKLIKEKGEYYKLYSSMTT